MNAKSLKLYLAIGSVCLFGTALKAQSYEMKAEIPFAFHVGQADFEAGNYRLAQNSSSSVQFIQSAKGHTVLLTSKEAHLENSGKPRLVFHRYGSDYFLSEVWNTESTGCKLSVSKREREYTQAASIERPENVAVMVAARR